MEKERKQMRFAVAAFNDLNGIATTETALRQIDPSSFETALFADRASLDPQLTSSLITETSSGSPAGTATQRGSATKPKSPRDELAYDNKVMVDAGMSTRSRPLVVSAGALSELFLQAGAGPGVEISPILEAWMPHKQSLFIENLLAAERLLLWVRIPNLDFEAPICRTLLTHSPYSVQTHDIAMTSRNLRPGK